jgi:adenine-specific DNA-methyltransferase
MPSSQKSAFSKERIEALVAKYKSLTPQQRKALNESQNCKDFILPLFGALGWDVYSEEVATEENIGGKRADYTFRLNGVAKFFLEAKKPGVDLHQENFAEQAISYAWHKSVPWAILTNFETLKVFSAEWDEVDPERSLVFEIKCDDFITDEKLALLSRPSIEKGEIDTWAEREFKKPKRENVDVQLAKDLIRWRNVLFENLKLWNGGKKVTDKQIAKSVQTLLDRLIFMRTTEDRGIENEHLRELLRNNEEKKANIERGIKDLFRGYDSWYDSRLFEPQLCDELEYEDSFLKTVIGELYKNTKGIRYNFAKINADVLGSIYEQYLGQIQQGDAKNSKRKQQGIYYTPRYIVDFIVRNAVLEPSKNKPAHEIAKLRILDPACGSGSFLTRAFEAIDSSLRKQGWDDAGTRLTVTPQCIYGVDLDDEAVEIAQLNLLLRMVYQRELLPNLTNNIECGNSLLYGEPEKLEKVFGSQWKDRRPFDWYGRFSKVFGGGGFDAIIGNPPYIKEYVDKSAFDGLHDSPYYQGKTDIWTLFACQAIDHLKDGGYFSFIAPNSWLTNAGASIFRDKILSEGEVISFIDFGDFKVFKEAGIQTMIFTFEKKHPRPSYPLRYAKILNSEIADDDVAAFLNSNLAVVPEGVESFEINFEREKFLGKTIAFSNREDADVVGKIEKEGLLRLDAKDVGQGIVSPQECVTRSHKEVLTDPSIRIGEGIFVLSDNELNQLKLPDIERPVARPYYESTEIARFYADRKNKKWILYMDSGNTKKISSYPTIKAHLDKFGPVMTSDFAPYGLHRARDQKFFDGGVILSLRKTAKPAFSYVDFPCYVSQSFYAIKPHGINSKYLTALLNSKVAYFWFKNRGKVQGDNLQIDKEPLMNFPVKIPTDKKGEERIVALVDEIMELNAKLHQLDVILEREARAELQNQIARREDQIDAEIYNVYDLSPDQINVIKQIDA